MSWLDVKLIPQINKPTFPLITKNPIRFRFIGYYPEYESKLRIDHSRIVDLLQVFYISGTMDMWAIRQQWPSLKCPECRDPDSRTIRPFNIDFYGSWVTKALNGD